MTNEQKIIKKLKRCISEIEAVIDDLEAVMMVKLNLKM